MKVLVDIVNEVQGQLPPGEFGLCKQKSCGLHVYLHIERRVSSDHKWSLETYVGMHPNARCEQPVRVMHCGPPFTLLKMKVDGKSSASDRRRD